MTDNMLKVLVIPIYDEPYICEIDDDLKKMQDMLMGCIDVVRFASNALIVCNKEGEILNMTPNRIVTIGRQQFVIRGNFFIVGCSKDSEDFLSLSDEDAKKYKKDFSIEACNKGRIFLRRKDSSWISTKTDEEGKGFVYYELYQARIGAQYKFFGRDVAKKLGVEIKPEDYKKVYHAATRYDSRMKPEVICERLFDEHNTDVSDRPGHSMSVSDIVILHLPDGDEYYYTEAFGFSRLENFVIS